ncbi:hypothetical protein [Nesterenkonia sandarakina]|uniref:Uncharacterized protein n=1 Tax=Nesterenkonia sandarakina TaxID=272918 RepID=A0A7Z0E919_9MICC|nr:hypothetical protein [Nesterenkonia sandarakina]NYJ17188.1 hypothetical protein [Nesterenkonia sandarakina]
MRRALNLCVLAASLGLIMLTGILLVTGTWGIELGWGPALALLGLALCAVSALVGLRGSSRRLGNAEEITR